jgi:rhamnose transport system substrate-binding protein
LKAEEREVIKNLGSAARLVPALAVTAAAVGLAACGSSSSGDSSATAAGGSGGSGGGHYTFVAIPKLKLAYYDAVFGGMQTAAKDLGDKVTQVAPTQGDPSQQVQLIQNQIAQKPDGLLVSAVDPQAVVPALQQARRQGIKTVAYDSDTGQEGRDFWVTAIDGAAMGKTLMEQAAAVKGPAVKYAIVSNTPQAASAITYIKGIEATQKSEFPKAQLVGGIRYGQDNVATSRSVTLDLLNAHPEIQYVIAIGDGVLPGVVQAIENLKKRGTIGVTGLALPSTMKAQLESGAIKVVYIWDPRDLGYMSIEVAHAEAAGKIKAGATTVPGGKLGDHPADAQGKVVVGPPLKITKANLPKYPF